MSIAAAGYSAIAHRLALGIEPIDALRGQRALAPLAVACDAPAEDGLHPRFDRHPSNRFVLRYDATLANGGTVDLRLFAARGPVYALGNDTRRYVPRRLRIALPTLAVAEQRSPLARVCRPRLFPGAAHPVSDLASGVRARVLRAATASRPPRPARWIRVEARLARDGAPLIGRAFGDDRGEFLLLIPPQVDTFGAASRLRVRLRIFAPPEPTPPTPDAAARDPLWDLPLEAPTALDDGDGVVLGAGLPAGYAAVLEPIVEVPLGRLVRGLADFVF